MTQLSILITAALLFGAAVYVGCTTPRKGISQEFLDEIAEVLVTISTFAFIVAVIFF